MNRVKERIHKVPVTVKVSVAYAVCSILQKCLSFITLPLFTRLLTTEQYGQVTIYGSWEGLLSIFLTLNLAYGSFQTAMVKFENDRDGYISSVQGICVLLSAAFLAIYLPFHNLWNKLFELPTYIMCIMVAQLLAVTAQQLWMGKKRFEFKYIAVVTITLATSIVSPILQYIFVVNSDEKGYARIIGGAIVSVAVGAFFFARGIVKGKKLFNKEYWKYAFGFNVPLLAYYISQMIFNQSDRIMISHMVGKDKAAIYGVAYTLAMIMTFVLNAINNSYVPWYYGKIKEGNWKENRIISLVIAGIMALLLLAVIWFAPEIILIMAGEKYAEAVYCVAPVSISLLLLFYTQLWANVEFYYEEKKKLVGASIGAALINLILNFIFIKLLGFVAAAYTTLISYIIFCIANHRAMKQVLDKKGIPDDGYDYKGLILLFITFVVIAYWGVAMYNLLIPRIAVTLIVLLVVFIKRKYFIGVYKKIKEK